MITGITRNRTNRRREQRKKRNHLAYESEIRRTNGTSTVAYLWTNMLLFQKATGTRKQTKPKKKKSFYTPLCVHWVIQEHAVSVGLIILAVFHIPHQKDWNGNMTRLCNTRACVSCSLPGSSFRVLGILYVTSVLHNNNGSLIAWEENRGEGNVNWGVIKSVEWAGILEHRRDKRLCCVHINLGTSRCTSKVKF